MRVNSTNGSTAAGEPTLTPELYAELRALAADRLADERDSHTLTPTALVHEAYLKLADRTAAFADRAQFLAAAAAAMRQILLDHARRRRRGKRGGGIRPIPLHLTDVATDGEPDLDLLGLHDALTALAAEDPAKARLVELRVFGGLTLVEAADAVGVSRATAARHWAYAKAWLYDRLSAGDESGPA